MGKFKEWASPCGRVQLYQGDVVHLFEGLKDDLEVDALVTDPPYSSGGFTRGDKMAKPSAKYLKVAKVTHPEFTGDNRSQKGWEWWMTFWLSHAVDMVRPGGYTMLFSDWRQLTATLNTFEAGGFVHRGIISWDKERSRAPHKGYFMHQCEFVVWGTNGQCDPCEHAGPFPGAYTIPIVAKEKQHMTGKPVAIMRKIIQPIPPGDLILDPFMGSASTGVAAIQEGRRFVGFEKTDAYFQVSVERMKKALDEHDTDIETIVSPQGQPEFDMEGV